MDRLTTHRDTPLPSLLHPSFPFPSPPLPSLLHCIDTSSQVMAAKVYTTLHHVWGMVLSASNIHLTPLPTPPRVQPHPLCPSPYYPTHNWLGLPEGGVWQSGGPSLPEGVTHKRFFWITHTQHQATHMACIPGAKVRGQRSRVTARVPTESIC